MGLRDNGIITERQYVGKTLVDEQYEAADKLKSHILNFY
jgi:hypothetical protein